MTAVATAPNALTEPQLNLILQYTVEAYKTFEKLAENLPNPMAAQMFKSFAVDEREARDLIELKILAAGASRVRVTLGGDLLFEERDYLGNTGVLHGRIIHDREAPLLSEPLSDPR